MTPEEIKDEMTACRYRLSELQKLTDEVVVPFAKAPPKLVVGVTRAEFDDLQKLAHTARTSVSKLGQLAVQQLLLNARAGALPMVAPSTADQAIEISVLGHPLV